MDELLNGSDDLHIEILHLMESLAPFPGVRHEVALVACAMALEHALSLRLLVRTQCYTSALAMMRLQYESLTRGVWLLYAATDLQVDALAAPLTLDAEQKARKLPMFSQMLAEVVKKAPVQASRMLASFKDVNGHAMNSFVHSGIHPLRRYAEGYPPELIDSVIRNSNGLNVVSLQQGLILSGDTRLTGTVRDIQEKHRQVLPSLISPPD